MTYKVAIEILEAAKKTAKNVWIGKTFDMAISALEKEMPQKIQYSGRSMGGNYIFRCPRCDHIPGWYFCGFCGQAIDWED